MESSTTLENFVQQVSKTAAHRAGITDPNELTDLYQDFFARLWQSADYPRELQPWLELHARREAQAHKKRKQRSSSRAPFSEDLHLAPQPDLCLDPGEAAYTNEVLASLSDIASDNFEKSALAWLLGVTSDTQSKSAFLSTQKDYSKGHAYKRLKKLEAKLLHELEG